MPHKVTALGCQLLIGAAVENLPALWVFLSQADFDVDDNQVVGDFVEANFNGYGALPLVLAGLEVPATGIPTNAVFVPLTWSAVDNASPNWIYGYWVADALGNVWFSERFDPGPKPMVIGGEEITIPVVLQLMCPT